ncbi:MAG: hypothetical protein ACRC76_04980 [Proteocatella sp.]
MDKFKEKWSDILAKNKVLLAIIFMSFLTVIVIFFTSNISHEAKNQFKEIGEVKEQSEKVDKSPKIEISTPFYVNYEEIKTSDEYIKKDDSSKYSQIKIRNISKETLYDIFISLETQETNKSGHYLGMAYTLSRLKAGEIAILSTQHEDVSEKSPLKVDEVYYMDNSNNYLKRKLNSEESTVLDYMVFDGKSEDVLNKLNSSVDVLDIDSYKQKASNEKNTYIVNVKNKSNNNLKNVYISFIEYNNGQVIGEQWISLESLEKEINGNKIILNSSNDLDLYRYGYTLDNFETKTEDSYEIYPERAEYKLKSTIFEEEVERKELFKLYKQIAIAILLILVEYIQKRFSKKSEVNKKYLEYAKRINWVKWSIFIGFLINIWFS